MSKKTNPLDLEEFFTDGENDSFSKLGFEGSQSKESQLEINKKIAEQNYQHNEQNQELRQEYLPKLFWLIKYWLGFIAFFLVLEQGILLLPWDLQILDKTVLIALITSTTASIIGIFYIVAKWLFPKNE